jgi:hypothetical protein
MGEPAGGVDVAGGFWVCSRLDFLLPSLPRVWFLPALVVPAAIATAGYMCDFNFYFH